jgi:DNA-binding NtrC family response regulator
MTTARSSEAAGPERGKDAATEAADRPWVLLAEDDREMRRGLAWGLRKDGYEVLEFKDGFKLTDYLVDALMEDPEDVADVIVSDIRMPGTSGLQILEGLRAFGVATPVILITAFGDPTTHDEATRLHACVLDKPFDLEDLLAAVKRALERKA